MRKPKGLRTVALANRLWQVITDMERNPKKENEPLLEKCTELLGIVASKRSLEVLENRSTARAYANKVVEWQKEDELNA